MKKDKKLMYTVVGFIALIALIVGIAVVDSFDKSDGFGLTFVVMLLIIFGGAIVSIIVAIYGTGKTLLLLSSKKLSKSDKISMLKRILIVVSVIALFGLLNYIGTALIDIG